MPSKFQPFQPLSLSQVNFSLTEGTDIPPPPDSPPETPRAQTSDGAQLNSHPSTPNGQESGENGAVQPPEKKEEAKPARPSTSQDSPTSKRNSGFRKLLSFNKLRSKGDHGHQNGSVRSPSALGNYSTQVKLSNDSTFSSSRPGSPYTTDTATSPRSLTRKRSSGWFNSNKRRSGMFVVGRVDESGAVHDPAEQAQAGASAEPEKKKGPPPPMLPEFRQFRSLNGELERVHEMDGEDLFANIGREK